MEKGSCMADIFHCRPFMSEAAENMMKLEFNHYLSYTYVMKLNLIRILLPFILVVPFIISCSATGSIGISGDFRKGAADNWQTENGGRNRNAARAFDLTPPLTLVWKKEGTSAFTRTITVSDSIIYATTKDARFHAYNLRNGRSIGKMKFNYSGMNGVSVNHHDIIIALSNGKNTLISYNVYDRKYNFIKALGPLENSPLIYDDFIYAATEKGVLHCMDYKDGNVHWTHTLPKSCHSSPALYLNSVIIGCDDGTIRSLNRFRGTVNWSFKAHRPVMHPPVVDSQRVLAATMDGWIYCLDAEKGTMIWSRQLEPYDTCMIYGAPAAGQGIVVTGSAGGSLYAVSLADGKPRWKFNTRGAISVTPVITGRYVYIGSQDGNLYAVRLLSGVQEWSYPTSGRIKSSPVVYGRYLVVAAENKSLYVFQSPEK